jgi:hypothetical protein
VLDVVGRRHGHEVAVSLRGGRPLEDLPVALQVVAEPGLEVRVGAQGVDPGLPPSGWFVAPRSGLSLGSGNARRCRTVSESVVQTRGWVMELWCLLDIARTSRRWCS